MLYEDHEEASFMDIDLKILENDQVIISWDRLYLHTALQLRQWYINDFAFQKPCAMVADDHHPPLLLVMVHLQGSIWKLLVPDENEHYHMLALSLDDRAVAHAFEKFLDALDRDLRRIKCIP
ncbi:hypothetical protein DC3_05760 [Deinococcus cellulosilyticus NBRC 106333 = KACC 11606]|uniref:Uncharacterized protein n=2 Tax=Deinococcus cellulosilyticus TaxID=401558 RepID=A0A511MX41_DEIC1|nr:hypothetical protein DC3_05760 [Deinococcus cellulosilyticus NBRC 106333 = KACC 11606]